MEPAALAECGRDDGGRIGGRACVKSVAAEENAGSRRIVLQSLHTPESLDIVYRRGNDYVPEAIAAIQVVLRDYRNGRPASDRSAAHGLPLRGRAAARASIRCSP